jgi:penicillin-binding protein 1A
VLASQLDRQYDKEEILFLYLENVYLGDGNYGVAAASENYFRKPVTQLTVSEAALLAGLIPAPSRYMPRTNPEGAEFKRKIVLKAMLETGRITRQQYDEALPQAVYLPFFGPPSGPATVVFPRVRQEARYPYFQDFVQRYLEARYGTEKVFRGGLRVETTLDPAMQAAADEAIGRTLAGTPPTLAMSLVSVEPATGHVRALVGGRDFATSKVNLALGRQGGGTGRQPGSAFKPYVLATAFEKGVQPSKAYSGPSPLIINGEDFHNYGGSGYGVMDLRRATHKSVNTIFVKLIQDVGVEPTMALANRLGLRTEKYTPGRHGLSVALGALEVSPLDMAAAYGVFAARGMRAPATPVVRVVDADGKVLEDNRPGQLDDTTTRVLPENVADNVTAVLRGVLESGGTAGGKGINRPAAGKTGTAQDNKDAWFVGYTPALSTAVWMGFPDPDPSGRIPLLRGIKGVSNVTGGSFPAETWQRFMRAALENIPPTDFNEPAPITPPEGVAVPEREEFEAGRRRYVSGTGSGGPYTYELPPPVAEAPTTSTSSTTTTTTFTDPDDEDDPLATDPSP